MFFVAISPSVKYNVRIWKFEEISPTEIHGSASQFLNLTRKCLNCDSSNELTLACKNSIEACRLYLNHHIRFTSNCFELANSVEHKQQEEASKSLIFQQDLYQISLNLINPLVGHDILIFLKKY